jgi:hypothetical protein
VGVPYPLNQTVVYIGVFRAFVIILARKLEERCLRIGEYAQVDDGASQQPQGVSNQCPCPAIVARGVIPMASCQCSNVWHLYIFCSTGCGDAGGAVATLVSGEEGYVRSLRTSTALTIQREESTLLAVLLACCVVLCVTENNNKRINKHPP